MNDLIFGTHVAGECKGGAAGERVIELGRRRGRHIVSEQFRLEKKRQRSEEAEWRRRADEADVDLVRTDNKPNAESP